MSQNNIGGEPTSIYKKINNCWMKSNSASVEGLETICCFLEDQDMEIKPKNTNKPIVDLLSLGTQSNKHH